MVIASLMLTSSLYQTLIQANKDLNGWDISLTWIGLLNWIPFFFIFISTKDFLKTSTQRLNVAKLLLSGSIPVLITGFGQYFLNWQGPITYMNGLIIWYLKPIEEHLGLSGLFSNQNYAGTWMGLIWPFSLALLFINKANIYKKSIALLLVILFTFGIILTTSRNALIGILITIPIILGFKSLLIILAIFSIVIVILYFQSNFFFSNDMMSFIYNIFPKQFFDKFNKFNLVNVFEYRRINLWKDSLNIISKRPLFGIGAGAFPFLYELYYQTNLYTEQHTHNLFLEISAGYGFIVSTLIFLFIISIIFYSSRDLYLSEDNKTVLIINKSWIASTIVILLSQMNDITYYDGRISIIFWILLSGSRNIFDRNLIDNHPKTLI